MTDQTQRYDELSADDIATLREEGASSEFIELAQYDDGERNSVRENARAVLEHGRTAFGHFGTHMWEGNLYKAFERADRRNQGLMLEVFGIERINADAQTRGYPGYEKSKNGRWVYAEPEDADRKTAP